MTAPQRWLHTPEESTDEERSLLKLGLDVGPPPDAEDRTWKAILTQLGPVGPAGPASSPLAEPAPPTPPEPPAPLVPPASAATPVATSGLAGALKAGVLTVVTSALLVTGYATLHDAPSPVASVAPAGSRMDLPDSVTRPLLAPPASASSAAPARRAADPALVAPSVASTPPVVVPVAVAERSAPGARPGERSAAPEMRTPDVIAPTSGVATTATPAVPASGAAGSEAAPSPQAERASRLREESALVGQANAALHAGNAGEALRLLSEANTRFPGGVLGQERELLTIEALARSGQRAVASERAAQFLRTHPGSPHAARLQPYLP